MTTRDVTRARTSRARGRHARARTSPRISPPQSESGCCTVAMGPYLLNREVDFANFFHANWYGGVGFTMKNSALLD